MIRTLVALLCPLVFVVACSSSTVGSGGNFTNDTESCSETGSCSCTKSCSHTCTKEEPCTYTCAAGATCSFSCPGGGCRISGEGNITVECAGGDCDVSCRPGATSCVVRSCAKGCALQCGGAAECSSSCKDAEEGCVTQP